MRRRCPDKRVYGLLSFVIGELNNRFLCYILVTRDGRCENILSIVDPGSSTISVVPALSLQEVGRLAFMARQRNGRLYQHGSGGIGGGTSSTSFTKGVMSSYRSTNIHISTTCRASCLNILLFIQFIFYMF